MPILNTSHTTRIELAGSRPNIQLYHLTQPIEYCSDPINIQEFYALLDTFSEAFCNHQLADQYTFVLPPDKNDYIIFIKEESRIKRSFFNICQYDWEAGCDHPNCATTRTFYTFSYVRITHATDYPVPCIPNISCFEDNHSDCQSSLNIASLGHLTALVRPFGPLNSRSYYQRIPSSHQP